MKNPFRPISISLSPNVQPDDVALAWKLLWQPSKFAAAEMEQKFQAYLGVKHAYSFNSGRSSLMAILVSLGLPEGSEVLMQAVTCNAAANPILWAGLTPVYVDCEEDFNIDLWDLERKITPKSRVVMVQHTFGRPADVAKIAEVCEIHKLILIEDCAHSLGAEFYKGIKVGTFGKAAFFSFSRDKIISCVYGGMAVTNDQDLAQKIADFQQKAGYPSSDWTFQQLLHPILMNLLILPTYSIFGKYLLVLLQTSRILSKAISYDEKQGRKPGYFPKRLPSALAELALKQFDKLQDFDSHRQEIAKIYDGELQKNEFILPPTLAEGRQSYLRYAVRHKRAHEIIKKAWQNNLLIGDWYTSAIMPPDTNSESLGYKPGSCPKAEKLARETLNLPTHINISPADAQKIIAFLKTA